MENDSIITLTTDDGVIEVEVIEQTVIKGTTYLLVATLKDEDAEEIDDEETEDECLILKDVSDSSSKEANYVIVEGKEEEDAYEAFENILKGDNIDLKK